MKTKIGLTWTFLVFTWYWAYLFSYCSRNRLRCASTHRSCEDADSWELNSSTDAQSANPLQRHTLVVLQQVCPVHCHLHHKQLVEPLSFIQPRWLNQPLLRLVTFGLVTAQADVVESGSWTTPAPLKTFGLIDLLLKWCCSSITLNWSLRTRMMISKAEPTLNALWCDTSSRPQRWFCSVLHTMHGDLPNLGLRWNATSALGFTLLPQVRSTWNLWGKAEEPRKLQTHLWSGSKADHLSASDGTDPWIRTISPGWSPPRMVPVKGTVCGDNPR